MGNNNSIAVIPIDNNRVREDYNMLCNDTHFGGIQVYQQKVWQKCFTPFYI